jgi:RNA-directed DNA polymerase
VTWQAEAETLQAPVEAVVEPLQQQRYRATLLRRRSRPQGNGQARPFGLPVIEDTLLQAAGASLRPASDAQEALACRSGYRPARGAGETVRDRAVDLQCGRSGYVVEADSQGFFDRMDQAWRLKRRRWRIEDRACLGLIRQGLKAGVLEAAGRGIHPDSGVPPGGVSSPVGANG